MRHPNKIKETITMKLFTSESVTKGHPDKICDQISDAILDAVLACDPDGRVACETVVTKDFVLISGEIKTTAQIDYEQIARNKIKEIGYVYDDMGFKYDTCEVMLKINVQSADISQGVDRADGAIGAGDQGIMFGYATDETKTYMPYAIEYANLLAMRLTKVRENETLPYLRPDGKTQVTVEYDHENIPKRVDAIVVSTQHTADVSLDQIRTDIIEQVIKPVFDPKMLDENTKYYINPTGKFVIGGPNGDAGLTGRKIIVDTYGGSAAHGGGAFSGKDYTKVDRSGAYIARYLAKNIVASKIASRIEIQLSYAIGIEQPISITLNTYNTHLVPEDKIIAAIKNDFDLSPRGIIKSLDLKQPTYSQTAAYGHFGKPNLRWEQLDLVEYFQKLL